MSDSLAKVSSNQIYRQGECDTWRALLVWSIGFPVALRLIEWMQLCFVYKPIKRVGRNISHGPRKDHRIWDFTRCTQLYAQEDWNIKVTDVYECIIEIDKS